MTHIGWSRFWSWRVLPLFVVLLFSLVPAVAFAQDATADDDDFMMAVNSPVHIPTGAVHQTVVVIDDDVVIDGEITETLIVINGDATIRGSVGGDLYVVSGRLTLEQGAQVENLMLYDSQLNRQHGATVTGSVDRDVAAFDWPGLGFLSVLWWIAFTVVMLVAGVIFAALGGKQLTAATGVVTAKPGESILTALIVFVGLPLLTVPIFATIVGIPLAIGILLFLLPAIWFLGVIVAGTALGGPLLKPLSAVPNEQHPYIAALAGIFLLRVVGIIPWIGWLVTFFAGVLGGGALVYLAWRSRRSSRDTRQQSSTPAGTMTPSPT